MVGLIRLSPIFPFSLINYAFGLTRVSLGDYFFASWIGMLPGTVMYVYIGSLIGDLGNLGSSSPPKTPLDWALFTAGFLAAILRTNYCTRIARKALCQSIRTLPA